MAAFRPARVQPRVVRETRGKPGRGRSVRIPERLLARLWQKRAARQTQLRTEGGARLRVVYPGRASGAAGPDFRNALLEIEGVGLVRGDVEIHLRQQDWQSHGHGTDPNYSGVVLHAVLGADSPDTRLPSGRQAPVVSLAPLLDDLDQPGPEYHPELWTVLGLRGYAEPATPEELGELLDRAGDDRFLAKSAGYRRLLREQGPDQTLYEGLMEGLGYRFNQQPFLKLAARAPYAALERAAGMGLGRDRRQALESWLLALGGFTPEGGSGNPPPPRIGFKAPLSPEEWHCFRVRPSNHPRRRIVGAAALLDRFLDGGLVPGLTAAALGGPKELLSALTADGGSNGKSKLIGRGRAADLAVNAALPFLHGLAVSSGRDSQAGAYLDVYHRFGKLESNELAREMARRLINPDWGSAAANARRQQGLMQLHSLIKGAG